VWRELKILVHFWGRARALRRSLRTRSCLVPFKCCRGVEQYGRCGPLNHTALVTRSSTVSLSCTLVAVLQCREVFQASQCPRHHQVVVLLPQAIIRYVYPPTSPPSNPTFQINSRRFVSSASFDPKITLIGLQWTRNAFVVLWLWFRRTIGVELSSHALRVFVPILSCKSLVPCEIYAWRESFRSGSVSLSIFGGS
jgi:hypothetical protein